MPSFTKDKGRLLLPLGIIAMSAFVVYFVAAPRTAASTCSVSSPNTQAYSVSVCITEPANHAPLAGPAGVTATVSISGASAGVKQVTFFLDQEYLITEHSYPYHFTLPADRFPEGARSLRVSATMNDGFTTPPAQEGVVIQHRPAQASGAPAEFKPAAGTSPEAGRPFILAAVGDGAGGEPIAGQVVGLVSAWNPNLLLYLGDVYDRGSPTEYYNRYAPEALFGGLRAITDPTMGDEEIANADRTNGYSDYWVNAPHYYSVQVANWHLVSLDSTPSFGQLGAGSPQMAWLEQDLAAHNGECTLVFFHDPVFRPGLPEQAAWPRELWRLLAQHGVDLVLTGGAHRYERWTPLDAGGNPGPYGVTHFVVGTGGHALESAGTDSRRAVAIATEPDGYGALRVELNPHGASFRYSNIQGAILDAGVVACSAAPADTQAPSVPDHLRVAAGDANSVAFAWDESADDTGVAGYTLYRDGAPIATVGGATQAYTDTNVVSLTAYRYAVDAFDRAGNHSALSAPVALKTPGTFRYSFTDTADATVSEANPSANFGSAKTLRADASPEVRSYLRFDLSGMVGTVTTATLRIYAESNSSVGYTVASAPDNDWSERTINYSNAPGLETAANHWSGAMAAGEWTKVDVTPLVKGNGPITLALVSRGNGALRFSSRKAGATAPQLIVETSRPAESPSAPRVMAATTPIPTRSPVVGAPALAPTVAFSAPASTPTVTGPLTGTVLTTIPVADAYVNEDNPQSTYGSAKMLRVDASPAVRSYLRFSVAGLHGRVINAVLRIYANSSSKMGYEVHTVADTAWVEKGLNFLNAPAIAEKAKGASGPFAGGTWSEVDLTAVVTGNGIYSFALVGVGPTSISLASRESGANAPQLVIQTDP